MNKRGLLIVAAVLAVFLVGGAVVIYKSMVVGGRSRTINITITGDRAAVSGDAVKIDGTEITVNKGDRVTLNITADRKEEIHVHLHDTPFEIDAPGGTVTRTISADQDGTYEYEIEDSRIHLGNLIVNP